jgi:hypothetical protein
MTERLDRLEAQANEHLMRIKYFEKTGKAECIIEREKDLLADVDIEIVFEKNLNPSLSDIKNDLQKEVVILQELFDI